jgi:hypothetical protein
MLAARVDDVTLELNVLDIEPNRANLQKYATCGGQGWFELHQIGQGLELYCDEDAALKGIPFTCHVRWQNRTNPAGPPAEVAFRGPVLILDRRAKDLKAFLQKVVQAVTVVDRPLSTGPAPTPKEGDTRSPKRAPHESDTSTRDSQDT